MHYTENHGEHQRPLAQHRHQPALHNEHQCHPHLVHHQVTLPQQHPEAPQHQPEEPAALTFKDILQISRISIADVERMRRAHSTGKPK